MNQEKRPLVKGGCGIYCFADSLPLCRKLLEVGAKIIQLRAKRLEDGAFFELASEMHALVKSYADAVLIINDRVEVARRINADGIHVGREDADYRKVIGSFPADTIVGVSVDTAEEAMAAEKAGAAYVGAGSVFPTATKPDAVVIGLAELARIVRSVEIPVVAIGGITLENIGSVRRAGADYFAIISGINSAPDIGIALDEFRRALGVP